MEQLITEIRARLDWIGVASIDGPKDNCEGGEVERNSVRLLDYGCGNGMISRVCPSIPSSKALFWTQICLRSIPYAC